MSPFLIFFIIVTISYIIYYAAIITIDLNTKPKTSAETSETVDTDGIVNETSEYSEEEQSDTDVEQPGFTINEESGDESDNDVFDTNAIDVDRDYQHEENFLAEQDATGKDNLPDEEPNNFDDDPYNLGDGEAKIYENHQNEAPETDPLVPEEDIDNQEDEPDQNDESPEAPSAEKEPSPTLLTGAAYLQENARRMMEGMDGVEFDDEAYKDNDINKEDIFEQEEPQYSVTAVINPEDYKESELVKRANSINEPIQAESRTPVESKQLTKSVFEMLDVMMEEHFSNV